MFTDRVILDVFAGKGGNGVVAWRREKFIPKGGPCGGDGGDGGSVIIRADSQMFTLDYYRNRRIMKAENGGQGGGGNRSGKKGATLILKVPCGTLIKEIVTGALITDLTEEGQEILLCKGGRGGKGNDHFKTPTNRAPNICTEGTLGDQRQVELELKLIADVGLVGFPNAGKSTLMTAMTRVPVKAAPYPFTTLRPNLGFFTRRDGGRIFVADIPGIIHGASENRGLGFEFLRHIERTKLLLFVLDASGIDGRNPVDDYRVLRQELENYSDEILSKPHLVVLNKMDDPESTERTFAFEEAFPDEPTLHISALDGKGVPELMDRIRELCPQNS